uniref:Ribosomal protein L4 n=1 Tax=Perca flavescens TaxID=8167 RepID=A0A7G9ISA5_PERFV|nr:ribosomal protein L4 [Perca flavescens]
MFQPRGGYRASDARRRHPGGAEPDPAARCPASPESPPTSGRGSDELERQRRTSSGQAGSSLQEEEDALIWQDPQGWWAAGGWEAERSLRGRKRQTF